MPTESLKHRWPLAQGVTLRRDIIHKALSIFRGWSYRDIEVPLLDHMDLRPELLELHDIHQTFRVPDSEGDLLMIRADVTPAIAKVYARQLQSRNLPLPLRVCYANRVVRSRRAFNIQGSESYQLGLELIGGDGLLAELEVILICLETLASVGIHDYQLNLGNVAVFQRLLKLTRLPSIYTRAITEAVAARDPFDVQETLLRFGVRQEIADALHALAKLRGGTDQIARIRTLMPHDQELLGALQRTEEIVSVLTELGYGDRLQIDLGEIQGPPYYTGVVFQVVSEEIGREIGGGGRYDELIGLFGDGEPAVGFALGLDALLEVCHPEAEETPVLTASPGSAVRVSQEQVVEDLREAMRRREEKKEVVLVPKRKPVRRIL